MPQSWSQLSEEMPCARVEWSTLPCINHTRFVANEQPRPQSSWLQNLGYDSFRNEQSPGHEWFEAVTDWYVG